MTPKVPSIDSTAKEVLDNLNNAYNNLTTLMADWDNKEQALLAQTSDTFSGNVTRSRITDAALSTLAFERQARVAAQLPTGQVKPTGKADAGKAQLADLALHNYIIPNAGRDFDMLTLQRLWGVYASVYGSQPMFYDYYVGDDYIGPYSKLVDVRMFYPQPGMNSIRESDWCIISTIATTDWLEDLIKKDKTSWDQKALAKLKKLVDKGRPSRYLDANKESYTARTRYSKELAEGQVELTTQFESGEDGHWITIAPDFPEAGVLRDIPNPHQSGRIPVVMRHCFPLMNSIFGLGDYERGMRIQKAKDSLTNLFLEGAKVRVFQPIKMDVTKVTPSTIKLQGGSKWQVRDMNAVQPVELGASSLQEFQSTFALLNGMLQNQFGTSDTTLNQDNSANPAFGKTPQALAMLQKRENARDAWDMFMHEQATAELYEGMVNLLSVKMEKPIQFNIFADEIAELSEEYGENVMEVFGQGAEMTLSKKDLKPAKQFRYIIDPTSSKATDLSAQNSALIQTWNLAHQSPTLQQALGMDNLQYDEGEHFKMILTTSGITNWQKIVKPGTGKPHMMTTDMLQNLAAQQKGQNQKPPIENINYKDAPSDVQAQMEEQAGLQPSVTHAPQTQQNMPLNIPQYQDPQIAALAQQIAGSNMPGGQNG